MFLEKQSSIFLDTADQLARMARETLVRATLPNFHLPAAAEILTTGRERYFLRGEKKLTTCDQKKMLTTGRVKHSVHEGKDTLYK